jgi:5-methyltetrahydrofolate--homocysteine methyltransferase
VSPEQAAAFVEQRGADVVALNCGTGMDMPGAVEVVRLYRRHCRLPTMAQPNAGLPVMVQGRPVYQQTPADLVRALPELLEAGAAIVGSCCGTTPEHTRAIRQVIDRFQGEPPRS